MGIVSVLAGDRGPGLPAISLLVLAVMLGIWLIVFGSPPRSSPNADAGASGVG